MTLACREGRDFEMFSQIARLHPGPGEWSGQLFLEDQCPVRGKKGLIRFLVRDPPEMLKYLEISLNFIYGGTP